MGDELQILEHNTNLENMPFKVLRQENLGPKSRENRQGIANELQNVFMVGLHL